MRRSFLYPIPQIELSVSFLDEATDMFIKNSRVNAAEKIVSADMKEISAFYKLITGHTNYAIHWQHRQPRSISKAERASIRMPSIHDEMEVFCRDGWRCRYCGTRVVSRQARKILIEEFPVETHWVRAENERHASLQCQAASLDHILPHSRGGDNERENLVTACGPCQFGRNQWTLEEVGFMDPRDFPPRVDEWDGLLRLIGEK